MQVQMTSKLVKLQLIGGLLRTDVASDSNRPEGRSDLAECAGVLDLFLWFCYRCFTAKGEEKIPQFGAFGLANQLGSIHVRDVSKASLKNGCG